MEIGKSIEGKEDKSVEIIGILTNDMWTTVIRTFNTDARKPVYFSHVEVNNNTKLRLNMDEL